MENKQTVAGREATKNDLSTMSHEEVLAFAEKSAKKAHDQELARKKLKEELDNIKASEKPQEKLPEDKVSAPTEKPEVIKEQTSGLSEKDVIAYSKLVNQGYSADEIQNAKSLVGTALGDNLESVVGSAGYQAQLKEQRQIKKSQDISIDDLSGINTVMSDEQFMSSQNIDLKDPNQAERYKKILLNRMKQ